MGIVKKLEVVAAEKEITTAFGFIKFVASYIFLNYFLSELATHMPNFFTPFLHKIRGVKTGKNIFVDRSAYLDNLYPELITLEDGVRITAHVVLICHISASQELKEKYLPFEKKAIRIKKHAFVGVNATILPGVTIGEYAVVGAGAVVTKDVADYSVVCGNPASEIRKLKQ